MSDHEARARAIIEAGYCGTCKRLCGGYVICGTSEYPCDYPVWEPLRQNDELFISAIAKALSEAVQAERDRCAKTFDEYYQQHVGIDDRRAQVGADAAASIRGEKDNG